MIMAITGRRGRPPNPDKEKPRRVRALKAGQARRPGRPPKPTLMDLLSKVDAKLLKRLEAKGECVWPPEATRVYWQHTKWILNGFISICRSSHGGGEGETRENQKETEEKGIDGASSSLDLF